MDLGISGKLALVVGASRGMGFATATLLAQAGARVICASRSKPDIHTGDVEIQVDITDRDRLHDFIDTVLREYGAPDIIVHVAGGSIGIRDEMLPWEEWEKVQFANIGAAHTINRAFLPMMVNEKWGRIVHFSSNGVRLATGNVPYIAAKHAVEGYVERMGRLYGSKGVVITGVAPGPIYTPGIFIYDQDEAWTNAFRKNYVPMGRWGKDEEVAGLVAFLCSQRSSYMSGAIVPVDGGMR